jgi:hypothetical protein
MTTYEIIDINDGTTITYVLAYTEYKAVQYFCDTYGYRINLKAVEL